MVAKYLWLKYLSKDDQANKFLSVQSGAAVISHQNLPNHLTPFPAKSFHLFQPFSCSILATFSCFFVSVSLFFSSNSVTTVCVSLLKGVYCLFLCVNIRALLLLSTVCMQSVFLSMRRWNFTSLVFTFPLSWNYSSWLIRQLQLLKFFFFFIHKIGATM